MHVQVSAQAQGPTVRVCVYGGDSAQAADCSAWLQEAVPATTVQMQCVFQTTAEDCLRLINTGGAELMRGGGGWGMTWPASLLRLRWTQPECWPSQAGLPVVVFALERAAKAGTDQVSHTDHTHY